MAATKVSPHKMVSRRVCYVDVLGTIWMPAVTASMRIELRDYDLENIGEFNRENVDLWLSKNAGDFQAIKDFHAVCGEVEIEWGSEESELEYLDTLGEID